MSERAPRRLYLFTGKGGVGKTSLSIAFSEYLQRLGHKAHFVTFNSSSLNKSQKLQIQELRKFLVKINVPMVELELEKTLQNYIAMKFNSKTIAQFIVKAPFFRSLINIIPGFNYVIFMGQLIKYMEDNPNHIYIIDGPASGHGLTLLNAIYKFKDIFGSGLLYQDCERLIKFLENPEYFKINVATLPQGLVANETLETLKEIKGIYDYPTQIIVNESLNHIDETFDSKFLEQYKAREAASLEMLADYTPTQVPLLPGKDFFDTIHKISECNLEDLI